MSNNVRTKVSKSAKSNDSSDYDFELYCFYSYYFIGGAKLYHRENVINFLLPSKKKRAFRLQEVAVRRLLNYNCQRLIILRIIKSCFYYCFFIKFIIYLFCFK